MIWGSSARAEIPHALVREASVGDGSVLSTVSPDACPCPIADLNRVTSCRSWSTSTSRQNLPLMIFRRDCGRCAPASTASATPAISATRSGWRRLPRLGYKAIKDSGENSGPGRFSAMRALLSHASSKRTSRPVRELRPIYGPFEGAMDRFSKLENNDFIGRRRARQEQAGGAKLRPCLLHRPMHRRRVMGDGDPIWPCQAMITGSVEKPHAMARRASTHQARKYSVPMLAECASAGRHRRWRLARVGWVTSVGLRALRAESMAQLYVPAALAEDEVRAVDIEFSTPAGRPHQFRAPVDSSGERCGPEVRCEPNFGRSCAVLSRRSSVRSRLDEGAARLLPP